MKVSCVSSVYGEDFHAISGVWYRKNREFIPNGASFHLVNLDSNINPSLLLDVEYSFRRGATDKISLVWGDGDLPRLQKIEELCMSGAVCVHVDLDLAFFRDITPILQLPYDFIISRAFAFPKDVSEKIGFVGCTGFYVAKPDSLPFLSYWIRLIERLTKVDQEAINQVFGDLEWKELECVGDHCTYSHTVSTWNDVSILVLDSKMLPRNIEDISDDSYGVHNPKVISDIWGIR